MVNWDNIVEGDFITLYESFIETLTVSMRGCIPNYRKCKERLSETRSNPQKWSKEQTG